MSTIIGALVHNALHHLIQKHFAHGEAYVTGDGGIGSGGDGRKFGHVGTINSGLRSRVKNATQNKPGSREESVPITDGPMKIGEFAPAAGVSIDAIRFYERRGLLRQAPRTPGGYRTFLRRDIDRIRLARQLQQVGLTIDEVVDALAAHDRNGATCSSERWRLEQVQSRINDQMSALNRTRQLIQDTLAACDAGRCRLVATDPRDRNFIRQDA